MRRFILVLLMGGHGALAPLPSVANQASKSDGGIVLRWKPKLGEMHFYRVAVKFDYGEESLQFDSTLKVKVMKVGDDGSYTIQTSTSGATVTSGNEVRDLPVQPPVTQFYTKLGLPTGASLAARDPDPFADLLDHLTDFQSPSSPIKVKDTWVNQTTQAKTGLFGQPRLSYTLVDVYRDGIRHMAKIRYQASIGVDAEAASGTIILDRSNNFLSDVEVSIPRFDPDGAKEPTAVTISLKEKEPG